MGLSGAPPRKRYRAHTVRPAPFGEGSDNLHPSGRAEKTREPPTHFLIHLCLPTHREQEHFLTTPSSPHLHHLSEDASPSVMGVGLRVPPLARATERMEHILHPVGSAVQMRGP